MHSKDKPLVKREEYLENAMNNAKNYLSKNFSNEFKKINPNTKISFPEFIVDPSENFDTQTFSHDKKTIELKIPKKIFNSSPSLKGVTYEPFFENLEFKREFVSDYDYVIDFNYKMLRKNSYFISLVHEISEMSFYKRFSQVLSSETINSSKENLAHGYALFFEMLTIEFLLKRDRQDGFSQEDKEEFKNYSQKRRNSLNRKLVEKEYYVLFNAIYQFSENDIEMFHENLEVHLPKLILLLKDGFVKDNNNGNLEGKIKRCLKHYKSAR
ncbi:MAG: hypothetical protein ACP5OZ_04910 [Candidatus Woesearchaeota archaeon]